MHFIQVTFILKGLPSAIEDTLKEESRLQIGVLSLIREDETMKERFVVASESGDNVWRVTSRVPMWKPFQWAWAVTSRDTNAVFTDPAGCRQSVVSGFSGILNTTWGESVTVFSSLTCGAKLNIHRHCQQGEVMAVVGSGAGFGFWGSKNAVRATEYPAGSSDWTAEVLLDSYLDSYEWKWVVLNSRSGKVLRWEKTANRHIEPRLDVLQVVETVWNNGDPVFECDCSGARGDKQELDSDETTNYLQSAAEGQEEKKDQTPETSGKTTWWRPIRRLPALLPFVYNWCKV